MLEKIVTLDEFIIRRQKDFSYATGELTALLRDIGVAAKIVNREVNKAGLSHILGSSGMENKSGDTVQKLDIFAHDKLIECLSNSGECSGVVSEEAEGMIEIPRVESKSGHYVVMADPLDGSSNIDVNVSVGTIFSIYRRVTDPDGKLSEEDFLQPGQEQVAAGYVLYGTSTILVYTTGNGINAFTLDPTIGEFCLSHRNIKIPEMGSSYSVNQGYYLKFDLELRRYIDECSERNYRLRYIGSLVSDIHRILFQGGIFLYPNTRKYVNGKLRLTYECNPVAFIIEQAGGKAINCQLDRIMDIKPHDIHQRSTCVMGSPKMVDEMTEFIQKYRAPEILSK